MFTVSGIVTDPPRPDTFSPAANGMPTLPGPTSQMPLPQAKVEVSVTGTVVVAAVADAPRLGVSSDPAITRTLDRDRIPTSPGRTQRPAVDAG